MKNLILLFVFTLTVNSLFPQAGAKWATNGNIISSGEFIGTTNNFPLDFRTNNIQRMSLDLNGVLNLNSLSGVGQRVLLSTSTGNLMALPQGSPGQFLQYDGTWGTLPLSATSWGVSGNDIFNTNTGFIGIGTNTPQYLLDINGNVRIKNNLLVEGKILISERVESGIVRSDSIVMDSATVIIGDPTIGGDLTAQSKLNVMGNANFSGNLNLSSLAGIGDRSVYVDAGGNLKVVGTSPFPSISSCVPSAPSWHVGGDNMGAVIIPSGTDIAIGTCDGADFILKANNAQRVWIKAVTGRIGFNTNNPDEQFHFSNGTVRMDGSSGTMPTSAGYNKTLIVNGDVSLANYFPTGATGNPGNGFNGIEILGNDQVPTRRGITSDADPNGNLNFYINSNQTPSAFKFKNGLTNTSLVSIYADGRTAIGDTYVPSGYMLSVNGAIVTTEVLIKLRPSWPDYVFSKEYKLMSLYKLEDYINKHSHLPNIPSAQEIKTNGLSTGEILSKQMEKIEELTLYMIEMQKQIDQLKKENLVLKAQK